MAAEKIPEKNKDRIQEGAHTLKAEVKDAVGEETLGLKAAESPPPMALTLVAEAA